MKTGQAEPEDLGLHRRWSRAYKRSRSSGSRGATLPRRRSTPARATDRCREAGPSSWISSQSQRWPSAGAEAQVAEVVQAGALGRAERDAARRSRSWGAASRPSCSGDVAIGVALVEDRQPERHQQEPRQHEAAAREHDRAPDHRRLPGDAPADQQQPGDRRQRGRVTMSSATYSGTKPGAMRLPGRPCAADSPPRGPSSRPRPNSPIRLYVITANQSIRLTTPNVSAWAGRARPASRPEVRSGSSCGIVPLRGKPC
jgi:hypothetical protein